MFTIESYVLCEYGALVVMLLVFKFCEIEHDCNKETEEIGVLLSSSGPMANSNWWRPHVIEPTEHVEQTLWIRRVAKKAPPRAKCD